MTYMPMDERDPLTTDTARASDPTATGLRDISLRKGQPADIDVLARIDLDAGRLYEIAGLRLDFPSEHEFALAERERWLQYLQAGTVVIAADQRGRAVGFAAMGLFDGEPYLDQLSVCLTSMRSGIGTQLLLAVSALALKTGHRALWLLTYHHVPWNQPFYARQGFLVMSENQFGMQLRAELAYQRRWLPMPQHRIVVRKQLPARKLPLQCLI